MFLWESFCPVAYWVVQKGSSCYELASLSNEPRRVSKEDKRELKEFKSWIKGSLGMLLLVCSRRP